MDRHPLGVGDRKVGSWALIVALAALCALCLDSAVWATPGQSPMRQTIPTLTPTPHPEWLYVGGACRYPIDYAPNGVPDLDQRQGDWRRTATPQVWTHSGPVAALNALWWLDSREDRGVIPPPAIHDQWPLLTAYGDWDDHDPRNVAPAVDDLAQRMDTNGQRTADGHVGTEVLDLVAGLRSYVLQRAVTPTVEVGLYASPTFVQLRNWVMDCDAVILNIGLWQWQGEAWVYLGAHYVTLAGVEPLNRMLVISDPYRDALEAGRISLGRVLAAHPQSHGPEVHDDVRFLCQDAYHTARTSGPGGVLTLTDYVDFWTAYEDIENHIGQNVTAAFRTFLGRYSSAEVSPVVDYAIVLDVVPQVRLMLPVIRKGAR